MFSSRKHESESQRTGTISNLGQPVDVLYAILALQTERKIAKNIAIWLHVLKLRPSHQ